MPARSASSASALSAKLLAAFASAYDRVAAQCTTPRLFGDSPFRLNPGRSRCQINPADHLNRGSWRRRAPDRKLQRPPY
jgi:hypothetical protein